MSSTQIPWQPYSEELLSELQANNKTVFIDFTADWCITCKANEFLVLETADVQKALGEAEIVPLKADWTTGDETITKALKRYGGEGVPLYVLIPANPQSDPIVFPSLLTQSRLINEFKRVKMARSS